MDTITAKGYGVTASLTETELRAKGTNGTTHIALVGKDGPPELVIPLDRIASVTHKRPKWGGAINGNLVVFSTDGRKYQMHYRAKHADFAALADKVAAVAA